MINSVDIVSQWGSGMAYAGLRPSTILCRTRALRRLQRECGDLRGLSRADLIVWIGQYRVASTRSTMLSYVRSFYTWAVDEGLVDENPAARLPKVKVPASLPRPIDTEELARALALAPPRERLWLELMAYAGLRGCEVAAVRPEHVRSAVDGSWWLIIPEAKGGREQQVPLPSWLAHKVRCFEPWHVATGYLRQRVSKVLANAGSTSRGHSLRHWYATAALQTTGNLRVVQTLMRHATPQSTAIYTRVSSKEATTAGESLPVVA